MAESVVFEWVSAALERATSLSALQVRGTVRLALRQAGLDAASVGVQGMGAVLRRILPRELASRGVAEAEACCLRVADEMKAANLPQAPAASSASDELFRRMFG